MIGDTIQYDPSTLTLTFEVAHVPAEQAELEDEGGLAEALHEAVIDPSRARMTVVYVGVKPDLLRHEAQAIVTGSLGAAGVSSVVTIATPVGKALMMPRKLFRSTATSRV